MKKASIIVFLALLICFSCEKKKDFSGSLILTGIKVSKGYEMISVNVDSGSVTGSVPLDCYVVGSTFVDPVTSNYGYTDCDTVLRIVNPETGVLCKSVKLPGLLSLAVTDIENHNLIGIYTKTIGGGNDSTKSRSDVTFENHLLTVSLDGGEILSDSKIDLGNGVSISVYYFDQNKNRYVVYRENTHLIQIDPATGSISKEVLVGRDIFNAVFNKDNNTIIGLRYSPEKGQYFLEVMNAETGNLVSSNGIEYEESFCLNISGYDSEKGNYYTVNGKYEVIFYSVPSGAIVKRVPLNYTLSDMKFWRRDKSPD